MPHSLRAKLSGLRYKGILEDKDYKRLCHALDLEKADQEQKSGQWIAHSDGGIWIKYYECSECGKAHDTRTNFCPNCGVRMVEPQESEEV